MTSQTNQRDLLQPQLSMKNLAFKEAALRLPLKEAKNSQDLDLHNIAVLSLVSSPAAISVCFGGPCVIRCLNGQDGDTGGNSRWWGKQAGQQLDLDEFIQRNRPALPAPLCPVYRPCSLNRTH